MNKPEMGKTLATMFVISYILLLLSACQQQEEQIEKRVVSAQQSYSFTKDIKPIMDHKCLVCHSCYDAPCQLKMESSEGLDRGASKQRVYDGGRLKDNPPTRLYIDAQTPQEWRNKGFYSVLSSYIDSQENNSKPTSPLMQQMLELGHNKPLPANKKVPEDIKLGFDRVNYCPAPGEFEDYVEKFPHGGMPLAVSGLDKNEYQKISTWLKQGAKIDSPPIIINDAEKSLIQQWETWLNHTDNRSKLVSRYVYEHLFLGHLYLSKPANGNAPQFYQLVRSYTPAGKSYIPVPTVRPNDDPQKPFFYRLIPIIDTIVHKTHITYRFDLERLRHYQQLFFSPDWQVNKLPGYNYKDRSNPFYTFAAIPAKQRYLFLLNDAEFFVRNFIRGPVCRGQIATNVIRDQFWLMFEEPDFEHYTNDKKYQLSVNDYLGLPGEKTSLLDFGSQWLTYSKNRNQYLDLRQKAYQQQFPPGATLEQIWDGDKTNDNAFLTVFRHHNSASVTKGWRGELPLTAWVMDYPLLERTYYELVVGFDVFGSVSHQAQTRLYFDLIRNGSETNFLRFMPASSRKDIYTNWYQSAAKIKTEITYHDLDVETPSHVSYSSNKPKEELLNILLQKYPETTGGGDVINRCPGECRHAASKKSAANNENSSPGKTMNEKNVREKISHAMSKIAAIPAKQLTGIKWLPEASFVRINLEQSRLKGDTSKNQANEKFLAYSLIRNRRHSSVAFILGESLRYQENLDTLTILPEPISSYPNLILQMGLSEVDDFVAAFSAINSEKSFEQFIQRWGVRRMSPQFWPVFHGFKDYLQATNPLQAGIYDMNRYGNW